MTAITDLDIYCGTDKASELRTKPEVITVSLDGHPDIRFTGAMLANVSTIQEQGQKRWTEHTLFKTVGGKFVCVSSGVSMVPGEVDRGKFEICSDVEKVKLFFGQGYLAKELYEIAGIPNVLEVE